MVRTGVSAGGRPGGLSAGRWATARAVLAQRVKPRILGLKSGVSPADDLRVDRVLGNFRLPLGWRLLLAGFLLGCASFPLWMPAEVPVWTLDFGPDKYLHAIASLGIGLIAAACWRVCGLPALWSVPVIALLLAGCEFAQLAMPHRTFEWAEVFINALGGALGSTLSRGLMLLVRRLIEHRLAEDARLLQGDPRTDP